MEVLFICTVFFHFYYRHRHSSNGRKPTRLMFFQRSFGRVGVRLHHGRRAGYCSSVPTCMVLRAETEKSIW